MLVYILALDRRRTRWARMPWDRRAGPLDLEKDLGQFSMGRTHSQFEPMFGHDPSTAIYGPDFRAAFLATISCAALRASIISRSSRRATLSQRAYGRTIRTNGRYSADIWGRTASDWADLAPRRAGRERHAAELVNTICRRAGSARSASWTMARSLRSAAGGPVAFAPEVAIPALMAMRGQYGERLYYPLGLQGCLSPQLHFYRCGFALWRGRSGAWLGSRMIISASTRTDPRDDGKSPHGGFVWKVMRKNPHIVRGLKTHAGFTRAAGSTKRKPTWAI